jgi:hypothetical protein
MKSRWLWLGNTGSGFVIEDKDDPVQKSLDRERSQSHRLTKELDGWKTFGQLAIVGIAFLSLSYCEGQEIRIEHDKDEILLHSWSWWGLSRQDTPIVWRENQWMIRNEKGEWEVAVEEPDYDPPEPRP